MNKLYMLREACCGSIGDVHRAIEGGADRVELCADLAVGGITPPHELILEAISTGIPVNVLIRPRGGNFVYDEQEIQTMIDDIRFCSEAGANAVVIGALTPEGDIDLATCRRLVNSFAMPQNAAVTMRNITFHRAFDECRDPFVALEQIIGLGCNRILTSGQAPTAPEGAETLKRLVTQAQGRIIILAGSGVTPENYLSLAHATGVTEVHGTRMHRG